MLTLGSRIPVATLHATDGSTVSVPRDGEPTLLYFMRSASCPVCNAHVRDLARRHAELSAVRVVVVLPGDPSGAAKWSADRALPFTVATRDAAASESLGLSRRMLGMMEPSGTVLIDGSGIVRQLNLAAMPTAAYTPKTVLAAVTALPATATA